MLESRGLGKTPTKQGGHMDTKMIVIKGFPVNLDRKSKAQAALEGISFKALVIKALTEYLEKLEN